MKKSWSRGLYRVFIILLIGIIMGTTIPPSSVSADTVFEDGDGTSALPYLITNGDQLNAIRDNIYAHYKLISDIDLSAYAAADGGKGWKPIEGYFSGSLDGDGYKITGLSINRSDVDSVGLFEMIYTGSITNLKLLQADVKGSSDTGILAGHAVDATLLHVYTSGHVEGNQDVGGLLGKLEGSTLTYTGSSASVYGSAGYVGGLVGYYYSSNNNEEISNSYAEGNVHAAGSYAGGLIGHSYNGNIKRSYSSGNVLSDQNDVGGLLGSGYRGNVQLSYALGSVSGADTVGGLIGYLDGMTISKTYAAGFASAGGYILGGFGGYNYGSTVSDSYWDETTTGTPYGYGWSSESSSVSGLITADMVHSSSFAGWSFSGTWAGAAGKSYPYLQDNAPLWLTDLAAVPNAGTAGTISPVFDVGVKEYNISVTNLATALTITAPAANSSATVNIVGDNTLVTGDNTATITVSDGNDRDQVYTLHIHKLASSDLSSDAQLSDIQVNGDSIAGFNSGLNDYTLSVPNTNTAANITASTHHADATYTVAGCSSLQIGSNICTIIVSASDGTQKTYTITVIRNRFAGGEGTMASPYLIATADQLNAIRDDYQKVFKLTDDIDLSSYGAANGGLGWEPIYFEGTLDGNGHSVTGLSIQRPNEDIVGLFQYIYIGSVTNLKIVQATVVGRDNAGLLVGWHSSGTVTNVSASGSVSGRNSVGGLIGYVTNGNVTLSSSLAHVTGSGDAVGGLIGLNEGGTVSTSYAEGNVQGSSLVGGLIGSDNYYGNISNTYATGQVTAVNASAGGLIGKTQSGTYGTSYATGKVTGASAAGGLVGTKTSGTVTTSYWNTTTSGVSSGAGSGSVSGITGITTANMKLSASFNTWNFSTLWNIVSGTTTPYLRETQPLWLTGLTVTADSGTVVSVSPSLDNITSAYTAVVASDAQSVTITGATLNPTDTITVVGGTNLAVGNNSVTVTIASSNGFRSREYVLNVVRSDPSAAGLSSLLLSSGALSPAFAEATLAYSSSVAYNVSSLTLTPTVSNAGSTVTVNGIAVVSGQASGGIPLVVGVNTVAVEVTSQDGSNTKTYNVTVTRAAGSSNANLSALTTTGGTLSPTFTAGTIAYTTPNVSNITSSITVRPTVADSTATVKISVNGGAEIAATSGSNSSALPLVVGSNSIVITVTAQIGTTKSYTLTVTRAASTTATLSSLTLSSGSISPTFTANTINYTSTAANSFSSVTVTPTVTNANATISVSVNSGTSTAVVSGQSSVPLALNTGSNVINVVVTAQDGTTIKTYKITVTRSKSTASSITAFSFEGLTPAVSGTITGTAISLTVPYGTSKNGIIATFTSSALSTVKIGTTTQSSGTTLNDFTTPVTYKVTAEDGTTIKNYTVTVTVGANTAKDLTAFSFAGLTPVATGVISGNNIALTVPFGTNASSLVATFTSTGSVVKKGSTTQVSGTTANDFSSPVTYTVTAADSTTKNYLVTVTIAANNAKDLTAFSLVEQTGAATIDAAAHTVGIQVANGTNLVGLTPTVVVSANATVSPVSGAAMDFSGGAVSYTVTAQNGDQQVWTVTVSEAPAPLSGANAITSFSLAAQTGAATIDAAAHTVGIQVANGTNLVGMTPTVAVSANATVSPVSGAATDFSGGAVSYTVTAQNGDQQVWTVTVSEAPAPLSGANAITSFALAAQTGAATIDASAHTVEIQVANGTNLAGLTPTVTVSANATVSPASGLAADFSGGAVTYTVTAQNGDQQVWTVTVSEAPAPLSGANAIVSFALAAQTGAATIDAAAHTVVIQVANGTNLAGLTPTVTVSANATVSPVSGAATDFSGGAVSYTVTAQNGDQQVWTVTVSEEQAPLSSGNEIISLTLSEQTGAATINAVAHTVGIQVANGTNLATIAPTITVSANATVNSSSGAIVDFSNGSVSYTVTAQNGDQQVWTVTVSEESAPLSSGNEIISLTLSEQTGAATIDAAAHTVGIQVANGTNLSTLAPTVTVSANATVNPSSGTIVDFSNGAVSYTVTAQNGDQQVWMVTVSEEQAPLSGENEIISITLSGQTGSATINAAAQTVTIQVTNGTNLAILAPTITVSTNATISPASGATVDFSNGPVAYTITAQNGINRIYEITVSRAASAVDNSSSGNNRPIEPNNINDSEPALTDGKLILAAGASGMTKLGDEVEISIPAGATEQELRLSIEKLLDTSNLNTDKVVLNGSVYEVIKNFSSNFIKPVTITLTFDPDHVQAGQKPAIYFYDEIQKEWVNIGGEISGNKVTAETNHFTKFAVLNPQQDQTKQPEDQKSLFSDTKGHWAEKNIDLAVVKGLSAGYPDGTFQPNSSVTRAEFAVMLFRAMEFQDKPGELSFTDSEKIGSWAKNAISQLVSLGIISGYGDGSFQPDKKITRAEMIVMLARAMNKLYEMAVDPNENTAFADNSIIPLWAKAEVAAVAKKGLLQGQEGNKFAPNAMATRAEAISVLLRILELKLNQ
ncbi:cadherin-like beta sandwich domain-containing protein [Paenibacillus psychroresistens]|nr:cadherin-like beta sandwich domain-containing protein [Paenibacillus psychroresistens]